MAGWLSHLATEPPSHPATQPASQPPSQHRSRWWVLADVCDEAAMASLWMAAASAAAAAAAVDNRENLSRRPNILMMLADGERMILQF